jgi:flagellar M-ring protein FliF
MATTAATFQPGFATANSDSTALTTTGGGALTTMGGAGGSGDSNFNSQGGSISSVQQIFQQPSVRKAMPLIVIALALLLFGLSYVWINQPAYRPLMANMSESDQQLALDALRQAEYKPVVDPSTGQLTVPANRYHEAKIFLASKGIPKTGTTGIDSLKDQSAMTTSQFMEQVKYTSAMEQELAKSITNIDSIQAARVHLATPKQSVFVRDRTPPKASVVVTTFPGRTLTSSQVQAVVHLVSSSIPLLTAENVAVLDSRGKLFTDSMGEAAIGLSTGQTAHKQKIEDMYRQRIMQILSPIVGEANVLSQVNMTLDFTQTEITTEDYDTREKGPKTRSEVVSEDKKSGKESEGGVPGTMSNTPPPAPSASTDTKAEGAPGATATEKTTTTSRATRNYELDRSVRHVKPATGTVEKLSVVVLVNERTPAPGAKNEKGEPLEGKPYTEEEIARMQSLVRGVVGYDEKRGDVVTVVQEKFGVEPVFEFNTPWYKDETIMSSAKTGLLALLLVAFIFVVIKPVVASFLPEKVDPNAALLAGPAKPLGDGELSEEDMSQIQLGEGETLEEIKAKLKPKKSNISAEMLDTANSYDDKVALVRMIVAEDAARVASVLKGMIRSGM